MSKDYWQKRVDHVLDGFDFARVQQGMEAVGWRWAPIERVPDEYDLRQSARKRLWEAISYYEQSGTGHYCESGGFSAFCDENGLQLRFVFAEHDSWDLEE